MSDESSSHLSDESSSHLSDEGDLSELPAIKMRVWDVSPYCVSLYV